MIIRLHKTAESDYNSKRFFRRPLGLPEGRLNVVKGCCGVSREDCRTTPRAAIIKTTVIQWLCAPS